MERGRRRLFSLRIRWCSDPNDHHNSFGNPCWLGGSPERGYAAILIVGIDGELLGQTGAEGPPLPTFQNGSPKNSSSGSGFRYSRGMTTVGASLVSSSSCIGLTSPGISTGPNFSSGNILPASKCILTTTHAPSRLFWGRNVGIDFVGIHLQSIRAY